MLGMMFIWAFIKPLTSFPKAFLWRNWLPMAWTGPPFTVKKGLDGQPQKVVGDSLIQLVFSHSGAPLGSTETSSVSINDLQEVIDRPSAKL